MGESLLLLLRKVANPHQHVTILESVKELAEIGVRILLI